MIVLKADVPSYRLTGGSVGRISCSSGPWQARGPGTREVLWCSATAVSSTPASLHARSGRIRPFVRSGLDAASQISAYDKIDTDRLRPAAVHNLGYWFFHRIQ